MLKNILQTVGKKETCNSATIQSYDTTNVESKNVGFPERRFVNYSNQEHALEWICEQLENIERIRNKRYDDRRDSIPDDKFQTSFYDAYSIYTITQYIL